MILSAVVSTALSIAALTDAGSIFNLLSPEPVSTETVTSSTTLRFDEALKMAAQTSARSEPVKTPSLRLPYLPSVRLEMTGNTSRTLDIFSEGPFEVRYASSAIAFDYPIWDGGLMRARINAAETRLQRMQDRQQLTDDRFSQLLDAFSLLYLAQHELDILAPLSQQLTNEADRSAQLMAMGGITNLTAAERSEVALAFESRLLEAQARRIDAASRLQLLTGLMEEPRVVLDVDEAAPASSERVGDDAVAASNFALEASRARLREVTGVNGFRATLSGFAGLGTASSTFRGVGSEGSSGVYGLRLGLSYPLLGGTNAVAAAEARADVEQAVAARDAAIELARQRAIEFRVREESARKRTELFRRSIEAAKLREASLERLVAAGMRTASDLASARAERMRREIDVLAIEVERWKAARQLEHLTGSRVKQ